MCPNFGYETAGGSYNVINNKIVGTKYTCPEAGTADSITAYVLYAFGGNIKCAIYSADRTTLIGSTEERTITSGGSWETFNFLDPKPSLEANTEYFLVAWSPATARLFYNVDVGYVETWGIHGYDGWPDDISGDSTYGEKSSIYCTYTAGGPPPPAGGGILAQVI